MAQTIQISATVEDPQLLWGASCILFCLVRHAVHNTVATQHLWTVHILLWLVREVRLHQVSPFCSFVYYVYLNGLWVLVFRNAAVHCLWTVLSCFHSSLSERKQFV